ncbi:MAG TPA: hypothetical protein VD963_04920 [Phycisphaerales bacterium]|nr:hypothetical protein [Phycisphaerales bacterium]
MTRCHLPRPRALSLAGAVVAVAASIVLAGGPESHQCTCSYVKCNSIITCPTGETCCCCSTDGGAWSCRCTTATFDCLTQLPPNTTCND